PKFIPKFILVNKSHNKTPYELFNGRSPVIGFLKPFGCHVMILNTLDNLGKFGEKGDEVEPKKISDALQDPSWVEAMQEELLQFKIQRVWTLVDCPKGEEGIDYDEVFAPIARIEAIRLFLAYASFMGFTVYQMDVKSAILYGTIDEEVYVMQPPRFQDPEFPTKVYKVEKAMYGLHQAPRAWYDTLSKYLLKNGFQRGIIDHTLFIRM
nr:hypothetical protein [Tanacetum cinerariifolium]